jgi:hypothetical protein
MAFTDFKTISDVQERFLVKYQSENFVKVNSVMISKELIEELEFTGKFIDTRIAEFAIRENLIFPILKAARPYADFISLWSYRLIKYDDTLVGTPDYFLSTRSQLGKTVLGKPLPLIMEAKKNDFDEGWAQCRAAMVTAQKMNKQQSSTVDGIVTDGKMWQFSKLEKDYFTFNGRLYTLDNVPELMGAWDFIHPQLQAQLVCTVS